MARYAILAEKEIRKVNRRIIKSNYKPKKEKDNGCNCSKTDCRECTIWNVQ